MSIKLFHTADLHIGMKFNSYPETVKTALQQARIQVLEKMIQEANQIQADLFVVAGDLFHSISGIDRKTMTRTLEALEGFQGEGVILLPGNHDYENELVDLWKPLAQRGQGKIHFVSKEQPYLIDGVDSQGSDFKVSVYPAPCHSKHAEQNNLEWIREWIRTEGLDPERIHIGVAHGSIAGLSPDMDRNYYPMTLPELSEIPMDAWLLGHTHITFPVAAATQMIQDQRIFNPGTPEPDGMDCKHRGVAWVIEIDTGTLDGSACTATSGTRPIRATRHQVGVYQFLDQEFLIKTRDDLDAMQAALLASDPEHTIARIRLLGRVEEELYRDRQEIYRTLESQLCHLVVQDESLGIRITPEKIHREFSEGSFPQRFLETLAGDEEALQMAYELVSEVRK